MRLLTINYLVDSARLRCLVGGPRRDPCPARCTMRTRPARAVQSSWSASATPSRCTTPPSPPSSSSTIYRQKTGKIERIRPKRRYVKKGIRKICNVIDSPRTTHQITSFNGSGNTSKYQTETQFQFGEYFGKTQIEMGRVHLPH